jgi:hypothetical protein
MESALLSNQLLINMAVRQPIRAPLLELQRIPEIRDDALLSTHNEKSYMEIEKGRRSIRFNVNENDCIVEEVFEYEKPPREYYSDLYTSIKEYALRRQGTRADVEDFQRRRSDLVKRLNLVFPSRESAKFYQDWAASSGRGLEEYLTGYFRLKRRVTIRAVLSYQDYLFEAGHSWTDLDNLLASRSMNMSLHSRHFAHKMAVGDALQVQKEADLDMEDFVMVPKILEIK